MVLNVGGPGYMMVESGNHLSELPGWDVWEEMAWNADGMRIFYLMRPGSWLSITEEP